MSKGPLSSVVAAFFDRGNLPQSILVKQHPGRPGQPQEVLAWAGNRYLAADGSCVLAAAVRRNWGVFFFPVPDGGGK